jgi:hypothetical protein
VAIEVPRVATARQRVVRTPIPDRYLLDWRIPPSGTGERFHRRVVPVFEEEDEVTAGLI